jgi:hypothetical protein
MERMPMPAPAALRHRATVTVLVLSAHALFVLLLVIERQVSPRREASLPRMLSIAIRLQPLTPFTPAAPRDDESPRSSAHARSTPAATQPVTTPSPVREAPPDAEPGESPQSNWYTQAAALTARYAEEADRASTFSPPPAVMRQPCTPRTNFDKTTRDTMDELLPPPREPSSSNADPASSSVRMGGVRVGVVKLVGAGQGTENMARGESNASGRDKSSFKWKWDSKRTGIAALTPGWEAPPVYDGMFDDMKAGKTLDSSVPDPNQCD